MRVASTSTPVRGPRYHFHEPHHGGRAEEMEADDGGRARGRRGNGIDVERRRVRREDASRLRDPIQLAEHLLLQREILEYGLDDQIRAAGARGELGRRDRMDARHALGDVLRGQPPADTDTS
jgi:hypothetical protein